MWTPADHLDSVLLSLIVAGAGTALLGKEGAMACTVAVETSIGQHYDEYACVIVLHAIKQAILFSLFLNVCSSVFSFLQKAKFI